MTGFTFDKKYSFKVRREEADRVLAKYPDRVPIIVEKDPSSTVVDIDKHKYLVPQHLTMGQFLHIIRKRTKIPPAQAIFMFINGNTLPISAESVGDVYERHKGEDNYLRMTYSGENTFGS